MRGKGGALLKIQR